MEQKGEYLIKRLVGEGGMGRVYEAEERLSKRRVALKVLRSELARSEQGRRLFLNEMTILAHLDHPNVVRCLACSEIEGELVMALEFLEGQTLRAHGAEHGPLPWTMAVGIVAQIAAGLGAAHAQTPPIIHRDLKPENVIRMPDGHVKVMDFGIAKMIQALGSTSTHSVGTLQYMSPEQIDAGEIDGRSDLYALGLVFYELLAGKPPFESASPRELLNLQCTALPPPLPEAVRATLPRGVERIVFSLLAKRPGERPESARALLDALEPFTMTHVGGQVREDGLPSRTEGGSATGSRAEGPRPGTHPSSPSIGSLPATARRPVPIADTIGLVERAAAPREVSGAWALAIIVGLSLVAGGITYAVKASTRAEPSVTDR